MISHRKAAVLKCLSFYVLADANAHGFIYPLVQGFVGQLDNLMFRHKDRWGLASITLIARRSTQRLGTRHWRRGADKQVIAASRKLPKPP